MTRSASTACKFKYESECAPRHWLNPLLGDLLISHAWSRLGPVIQWYRVLSQLISSAVTIAARFSNATMLSKTILMHRTFHNQRKADR